MAVYRKRIVVETVEAVQYDGTNAEELAKLLGGTIDYLNAGRLLTINVPRERYIPERGIWYFRRPDGAIRMMPGWDFQENYELVEE